MASNVWKIKFASTQFFAIFAADGSEFFWDDGSAYNFSSWQQDNPNWGSFFQGDLAAESRDCVFMDTNGKWDNIICEVIHADLAFPAPNLIY